MTKVMGSHFCDYAIKDSEFCLAVTFPGYSCRLALIKKASWQGAESCQQSLCVNLEINPVPAESWADCGPQADTFIIVSWETNPEAEDPTKLCLNS